MFLSFFFVIFFSTLNLGTASRFVLAEESNEVILAGLKNKEISVVKTSQNGKKKNRNDTSTQYLSGTNNVILFLIRPKGEKGLIRAVCSLAHNMPMNHPYPILFLNTGEYTAARQNKLLRKIRRAIQRRHIQTDLTERIEFVQLDWTLPKSVPNDVSKVKPVWVKKSWPGYYHMCKFFSTQIFFLPRLQNVDYYLRMDTDSTITSPMCEDPFVTLERENMSYGYRVQDIDSARVVQGLYKFTDEYSSQRPFISDRLILNSWEWPTPRTEAIFKKSDFKTIYNNFEIVKLKEFRRDDIKEFFDEINKDQMRFYKYRWGDAAVRYVTLNFFFEIKKQTKQFCDFSYHHRGRNFYASCSCDKLGTKL